MKLLDKMINKITYNCSHCTPIWLHGTASAALTSCGAAAAVAVDLLTVAAVAGFEMHWLYY